MFDSPGYFFKAPSKKYLNSCERFAKPIAQRDPFAVLPKNCSNKLGILTPNGKLPKLQLALPPKPSPNSNLEKFIKKQAQTRLNSPLKLEENLNFHCQTPSDLREKTQKKGRRLKITGSISNIPYRNEKVATKKRNSIVVLDLENNLTFGLVGNIVTKRNID